MKLTLDQIRTSEHTMTMRELHSLVAGDVYNPLVLDLSDLPADAFNLVDPSKTTLELWDGETVVAKTESFAVDPVHPRHLVSSLSLDTVEIRKSYENRKAEEAGDLTVTMNLTVTAASATLVFMEAPVILRNLAGAGDAVGTYTKAEVDALLNAKQDAREGYGLSEADYTAAEKEKLAGVETGAQKNVQPDWNATSGMGQIKNRPSLALSTEQATGKVTVTVGASKAEVVKWESGKGLSSNDYTAAEKEKLRQVEAGAQKNVQADWDATDGDALILHKPEIPDRTAVDANAGTVTVGAVTLDVVLKETGKGLSEADFTSAEKTKLAGVETGAQKNVQPDWNAVAGTAQIKNRPALALSTGTTPDKVRLTIGNSTREVLTEHQSLDSLTNAVEGKQDSLTFDTEPKPGSTNPVTSSGIYTALAKKQDTLTITSTPTQGSTAVLTAGGAYTALAKKQDTMKVEHSPVQGSANPVSAGALYDVQAKIGKPPSYSVKSQGVFSSDTATVDLEDSTIHLVNMAANADLKLQLPTIDPSKAVDVIVRVDCVSDVPKSISVAGPSSASSTKVNWLTETPTMTSTGQVAYLTITAFRTTTSVYYVMVGGKVTVS